ncbi:MAG: radical SAM protein [Syntrophales bacterium]|jgi:radical SAM protein with 4Fe4S-binding SPASM domain
MLSAFYDRQNEKLIIHFDISIPVSLENHGALRFIQEFKDGAHAELKREQGELKGFSVNLRDWLGFIQDTISPQEFLFQKSILDDLVGQNTRELDQGLDINFHQKPFDTPERYWNFILNQGYFIDYFFNRLNWYLGPKNTIVTPFPLHVDLESASTCNMNCPMCYRSMFTKTGQMDIDLFKKAVNECAENNVFSIRLSWRGETLTHPRIKEMIAYATSKIKNVSFLTNAFYIDEEMIDCFIENKLSYVSVSFDGISDVYESIRYPAKFEQNYDRLATLQKKKEKMKSQLPQVRVCTIWPAIKDDPEKYYHTMREVSDYIVRNPYINFKGPMKIKTDFICQYPWERIVIGYNGEAQCCTGWNADDIILGNVGTRSIHEMWHSDLMNRVRKIHAAGRRMELNSCANCRHGSQGDPNISIWEIVERRF